MDAGANRASADQAGSVRLARCGRISFHSEQLGSIAPCRRGGAADAAGCRRRGLGRGRRGMHDPGGHGDACRERTQSKLWPACREGGCRRIAGREWRASEKARGLPNPGHADRRHRQCESRHGSAAVRHRPADYRALVYAVYEKSPAHGGAVLDANIEEVRSQPGVKDVFITSGDSRGDAPPGVVIVADSTWAAFSAKRRLKVNWGVSAASTDSWSNAVQKARALTRKGRGENTIVTSGDAAAAFATAKHALDAYYTCPFVAHAPLEPQNTTAWMHDGGIEMWTPSQMADRGRATVASHVESAARQRRRASNAGGRRLWPAAHGRLHGRGSAHRAEGEGTRQARMDARRRHDARLLPRRRISLPQGRTRRAGQTGVVAGSLRDLQRRWPEARGRRRIDGYRVSGAAPAERSHQPELSSSGNALRTVARARLQYHRIRAAEFPA